MIFFAKFTRISFFFCISDGERKTSWTIPSNISITKEEFLEEMQNMVKKFCGQLANTNIEQERQCVLLKEEKNHLLTQLEEKNLKLNTLQDEVYRLEDTVNELSLESSKVDETN